ncbi:Uncharacterised protein [Actinobacillus equuli]|nr:Uncharacterised protein [Actinobacillus equuli]
MIDIDGSVETGRQVGEIGAHVKGHNSNSVGICLIGGITADKKTMANIQKRNGKRYISYCVN